MQKEKGLNALKEETSPYLLQHAENPVHWFPWSEQALTLAKEQNKPILLSIGYSACHWCHVMAHESFEDEETAELMNTYFINIKVDREERPDIDSIYQKAQQLLTQRTGGWPLTMFLTPDDHIPFFGGTYFPKEAKFGLPSFKELLINISNFYLTREDDIRKQNASFQSALSRFEVNSSNIEQSINEEPLQEAYYQLQQSFDHAYGGFGQAPKFPHPSNIERLLLHAFSVNEKDESQQAMQMALFTLEKMAIGGIYDHVGGGFSRYSVDQYWMIPHFEKMLYDNGPLLYLYVSVWNITGFSFFKNVTEETADWIIKEMQSDEGGYYSALDADSEGEEGKYYVWQRDDIQNILDKNTFELFAHTYGLNHEPNFEGKWHLYLKNNLEETATHFKKDVLECKELISNCKTRLYEKREQRIRPGLDDKILGSWNGLMVKGMAQAGRLLNNESYINSASKALDFIIDNLWKNARLLATYKDGKAHLNAYLDDYAFLIDACLQLLQAKWNSRYLTFATQLAETLIEQFYDEENGGFFFTSHDHEKLINREKPYMDNATPAGNGIACITLQRLGHLVGETKYNDVVENTLKASWSSINSYPSAHNTLLQALQEYLEPPQTIILRGEQKTMQQWQQNILEKTFSLSTLVFCIDKEMKNLPEIIQARSADSECTAYLCKGHSCLPPFNNIEKLLESLNTISKSPP